MYADIKGYDVLGQPRHLALSEMMIDVWTVQGAARTSGRYVSMHPRFVTILDGARLVLSCDKVGPGRPCGACFVPAGVELWGQSERPGALRHVDIHLLLRRLRGIVAPGTPLDRPVFLEDAQPLRAVAARLAEACAPGPGSAEAEALAAELIRQLFHEQYDTARVPGITAATLDRLRTHVQGNLNRGVSAEALADVAELSRTHFNRLFRRATGQSPYQWVMALRIDAAKDRLAQGMPLAEIAGLTGFSDQAHFTRVFKSATGVTPGRWGGSGTLRPGAARDGRNLQDNPT